MIQSLPSGSSQTASNHLTTDSFCDVFVCELVLAFAFHEVLGSVYEEHVVGRPFQGLLSVHSRCGPHTRAVTYT